MRQIGHLKNERYARSFGDYLAGLEIKNLVETESDGTWAVWIYSEDQLALSRDLLNRYLLNPEDPKYRQSAGKSAVMQQEEEREGEKFAKRVRTRENIWRESTFGRVTLGLIVACVGVFFYGHFNGDSPQMDALRISNTFSGGILPEVRNGQVWRLITPVLIHYDIFHLLFNMLMLKSLGTLIEMRQGPLRLGLLILLFAAGSNLGQYLVSGPFFGGMSGVIYGLFGYAWMRGKTDPASGLYLDPTTVIMMLAWFFLCLFGIIGSVANTAHGVGLVMGILLGIIPGRARKFVA